MADYLFDQKKTTKELSDFFKGEKPNINSFGSTVNQTFEAHIFAQTIQWYQKEGWAVKLNNPKTKYGTEFRLKFSTRGAPKNYSYATCEKSGEIIQIRHQLRTATKYQKEKRKKPANICCDIVVMQDIVINGYGTEDSLPNRYLLSFGEVKHMSAFAELIASFIGLVHELRPDRLKRIRIKTWTRDEHLAPFLYVSGVMLNTAKGINETIENRKFDIDVYSFDKPLL